MLFFEPAQQDKQQELFRPPRMANWSQALRRPFLAQGPLLQARTPPQPPGQAFSVQMRGSIVV